jgi:uncharacterized iron-regulated membrane protein
MKLFFRNIHLYLSLAAGLVIMTACLTGAILVFEKELEEAFHPDRYKVSEQGTQVTVSQLIESAKEALPGSKLANVKVFSAPNRSVEIGLIAPKKDEESKGEPKKGDGNKEIKEKAGPPTPPRPTHTVFVNPYTGKVIEVYSPKDSFFQKTMALHRWLLGKNDGIGKYIVGVSTFIFLFIILTGIILWWPKTRKIFAQRVKVKWDGNWKRLNHDLHLVFGFYSAIFLFMFAFTAMSWSFQWFNKGIYKITNSPAESPQPPSSVYAGKSPVSIDGSLKTIKSTVKDAVYYIVKVPQDSTGIYNVMLLEKGAPEMQWDTYYIDQYSGKIAGSLKFSDKNSGQKVRSYVKPIHTSSIFGLPSKILGFIVCILGVTFPITGVIMWLNRLKTERRLARRN